MTYTIYKHTNKLNGKHYVGVTKYTIEKRWAEHKNTAKHKIRKGSKFQYALRKYGTSDEVWEHTVIVKDVPEEFKQAFEKYWINYYDSFKNGYNATIGGDYFDGCNPPKGSSHYMFKNPKIRLFHKNGTIFQGTLLEFCNLYNFTKESLSRLLNYKDLSYKEWYRNPYVYYTFNALITHRKDRNSIIDIVKYYKKGKIPSIIKKQKKRNAIEIFIDNIKEKSQNNINITTKYKCMHTPIDKILEKNGKVSIGKNNPMYGTKRPQNVKDAVSRRRRNEADKTLRTWVHMPTNTIEKDITCLALRDKYPELNISNLNAIAKKLKNKKGYRIAKTHKGWKLYEED